jgi:hypothetical protein
VLVSLLDGQRSVYLSVFLHRFRALLRLSVNPAVELRDHLVQVNVAISEFGLVFLCLIYHPIVRSVNPELCHVVNFLTLTANHFTRLLVLINYFLQGLVHLTWLLHLPHLSMHRANPLIVKPRFHSPNLQGRNPLMLLLI